MKKIELNELSRWSPWPARLLNLSPFQQPNRTIEKVDREYDKDKYAKCLEQYVATGSKWSPEDVKRFEFGNEPEKEICVSLGQDLYALSMQDARDRYYQLLADTLRAHLDGVQTVVELGTGYGFNLWKLQQLFPGKKFMGGEYSQNAVKLAARLYAGMPEREQIRVFPFNFYEESSYQFIADTPSPALVFTSHAIEQCPSAERMIASLLKIKGRIQTVVHFEPVCELHDDSLLGLLRRRYTALNDYNRDLLAQVKRHAEISLLSVRADVFGFNPLNPTSIIEWQAGRKK
jgi:hypothetical protein